MGEKKQCTYRGYKIYYECFPTEKGFIGQGNFFVSGDERNYYTEHYFSTSEGAEKAILIFLKAKINKIITTVKVIDILL